MRFRLSRSGWITSALGMAVMLAVGVYLLSFRSSEKPRGEFRARHAEILPMPSGWQPVAAEGSELLIYQDPGRDQLRFQWLDIKSGQITPLATMDKPGDGPYYPVGLYGSSVLFWIVSAKLPSGDLIAHDVDSGADTVLSSDAYVASAAFGGRVAWASFKGSITVMDLKDRSRSEFSGKADRLAVNASHAVWFEILDPHGPGRMFVAGLDTKEISSFGVTAAQPEIAISPDSRYVLWASGDPAQSGVFSARTDGSGIKQLLGRGQASGGRPMTPFGRCLAWQPEPGSPQAAIGYFDSKTDSVRLVQTASRPVFGAFLGDWYVWGEYDGTDVRYYVAPGSDFDC